MTFLNWSDRTQVGWFLFLSAKSWALKEYQFAFDDKPTNGKICARIEYDGLAEGIPLVKSIEQWALKPDGRTEPRMTSHVVQFATSPSSSEKFTLAAFGLPNDLGEGGKPGLNRWLLIIVGLAGLAVSWQMAAWVRKRQHRGSNS